MIECENLKLLQTVIAFLASINSTVTCEIEYLLFPYLNIYKLTQAGAMHLHEKNNRQR